MTTTAELRAAAEKLLAEYDNPDAIRPAIAQAEKFELQAARHILATVRADDDEPVTEEWLECSGWSAHSLRLSRLLPPVDDGGAIAELSIEKHSSDWMLSITQGVPDTTNYEDDHVTITSIYPQSRGELRLLLCGLGIPLE